MEEGSLRCEPNLSLRPKGSKELGTRTEIKNKNSFQELIEAMEYEVKRQARILDAGEEVVQETLLFDARTGKPSRCEVRKKLTTIAIFLNRSRPCSDK